MRLLNVDTIDEARGKLLENAAGKIPGVEYIDFSKGRNRVLAEDITAAENVPGFNKSTVDGYAVRAKDTQGVSESIPVFLDVVGEVSMGEAAAKIIFPGQACYVPTGGMLPEGADSVVMIEHTEKFDENSIAVYDSVSVGRNVISAGEDIGMGTVFLRKGTLMRPQDTGVLASAGVSQIPVFKPWKVTVISTGDELAGADGAIKPGQTRDINTHSLSAAAEKNGFVVVEKLVLKDDRDAIKNAISKAMDVSDVVIVSGGSSQGDKDYTADIMDELSDVGVFTHGIAVKPGKPTILAYDGKSGTILAGLPGHPVAALLIFELFIAWLYRQLTCQKEPKKTIARITENVPSAGGKATCMPLELTEGSDGVYDAIPVLGKSGLMTVLTRADGYTLTDTNSEGLKQGEFVEITLF